MLKKLRLYPLVAVSLLVVPGVGEAQLGRLIKQKAAEKAAGKAAEKAGLRQGPATKHHAERYTEATIGTELDEATLQAVFRGMAAVHGEFAGVQAERVRLSNREDELRETAGPLEAAWQQRRDDVQNCQRAYVNDLMTKRMSDPQVQRAAIRPSQNPDTVRLMMALVDSMTAAAQRGDSVGGERLTRRYVKLTTGIDTAGDSAAAARKCGTVPERPAVILERERVRAQVDSVYARERAIEAQTLPKAAAASGLAPRRFALARERIMTWYVDQSGDTSRWSRREHAMFERHKDEIRRALGYGK